jgi:hypothetical protein
MGCSVQNVPSAEPLDRDDVHALAEILPKRDPGSAHLKEQRAIRCLSLCTRTLSTCPPDRTLVVSFHATLSLPRNGPIQLSDGAVGPRCRRLVGRPLSLSYSLSVEVRNIIAATSPSSDAI